uniref:Uncharacterized protein n=1 Tax=Rhizophora mucronata TaxID=61149 RepID=A0A2P2IR74_RHIMU
MFHLLDFFISYMWTKPFGMFSPWLAFTFFPFFIFFLQLQTCY